MMMVMMMISHPAGLLPHNNKLAEAVNCAGQSSLEINPMMMMMMIMMMMMMTMMLIMMMLIVNCADNPIHR